MSGWLNYSKWAIYLESNPVFAGVEFTAIFLIMVVFVLMIILTIKDGTPYKFILKSRYFKSFATWPFFAWNFIIAALVVLFAFSAGYFWRPAPAPLTPPYQFSDKILENATQANQTYLTTIITQQAKIIQALTAAPKPQPPPSLSASASGSASIGFTPHFGWLLFGIICIFIGPIIAPIVLANLKKRAIKQRIFISLAGIAISSFGICLTLFKADSLLKTDSIFKIDHVDISFPRQAAPAPAAPVMLVLDSSNQTGIQTPPSRATSPATLTCLDQPNFEVAPFLPGSTDITDKALEPVIHNIAGQISTAHNQPAGRPIGFLLVGSADPQPLHGKLQQEYGDNFGLAAARVKQVADALRAQLQKQPDFDQNLPFIMLVGPSAFGNSDSTSADQPANRAVRVCELSN